MKGKQVLFKALKITGITTVSIVVLLFILPILFAGPIQEKVKKWVNDSITSELTFSKARVSFFTHFPSLAVTLQDINLTGAAPFSKESLITAKDLSFGVNMFSLFSKLVKVDEIYLSDAEANILVDEKGNANYNIYKSTSDASDTAASDVGVRLEMIKIKNTRLNYVDLSIPLNIYAVNLNYTGKGDLSKEIFDLSSRLSSDSLTLEYDNTVYVNRKPIKAKLITVINTRSLSLVFKDNQILVHKLPMRLEGFFNFLQQGYEMDLNIDSRKTALKNVVTAIPPDMSGWLQQTKVKGTAVSNLRLVGRYNASTHTKPDLRFNLAIDNGYIKHKDAKAPLENLDMRLKARFPGFNPDSLKIALDTFSFKLDKGYCDITFQSLGLDRIYMESKAKADLDLSTWNRAVGLKGVEFGGDYKLDLNVKGTYSRGQNPNNWRKETVITSIPTFNLVSTLSNGYLKFDSLPTPIKNIQLSVRSSAPDNNYRHINIDIENINFTVLGNFFKGHIKVKNPETPEVDADISGKFRLKDWVQSFPVEDFSMDGVLTLDIKTKGVYDEEAKTFPLTGAKVSLEDGMIQTKFYPEPLKNIDLKAEIQNPDGSYNNTSIKIQPLRFDFDGEPFMVTADLQNLDNLKYDIRSTGALNLGNLYRVFGVSGYEASGRLKVDVALKGKESDALAGRYHLLNNSGNIEMENIRLGVKVYPKPFLIQSGNFSFSRDKMRLKDVKASYSSSDLTLNGYFQNVIAYAVSAHGVLKGNVHLTSDYMNLNDFTAYESAEDNWETAGTDSSGSGVIMVPEDLDVLFAADVKKAEFDSVFINNFKGQLLVRKGKVQLKQTDFSLAGAKFSLEGDYEGVNPNRGLFDFKVKADSFSVERAYNEIPIFRELASSASGVKGVIGMDYALAGRLNANMDAVLPSITGKGVINLRDVKLKGFRLMNAVSKSTNFSELEDPPLAGINIKSAIKNNIITIDRVKMRIAGFRPRFEGQISLDGDLKIKGRVGLPPFGLFGIPFNVSGTSENPVVKLKRDKDGKPLQEKEDIDEDEEEVIPEVPAKQDSLPQVPVKQ